MYPSRVTGYQDHQRKFQLKMSLLTLIQIPYHHVLANEIALNLNTVQVLNNFLLYNFEGRYKKKTIFFVHIFDISPCVFTQILSKELIGCGTKFPIQQIPTQHTFYRPCYPKNKKYLKKRDDNVIITFFRSLLFFGQQGLSKVCSVGTRWMQN